MIPGQVNAIYPVGYFSAEGNDYSQQDSQLWWSSANRYAKDGAEYVEIDLTKKRTINYISFDILKKPIDITIEYDRIDLSSLNSSISSETSSRWVSVKKIDGEKFDSSISYEAESINPWKHCEYYFTDANGDVLVTQRIRIKFNRRLESWPTANYDPNAFAWSIDVKNLRSARYITSIKHTRGILIETPNFTSTRSFADYPEARQRFFVQDSQIISAAATANLSNIDSFAPTDIFPRFMGFEILVKPGSSPQALRSASTAPARQNISLSWQLFDITTGDLVLASGTVTKTNSAQSANLVDVEDNRALASDWVRVLFDNPIASAPNRVYELRVRNTDNFGVKEFYVSKPNFLKNETNGSTEFSDLYLSKDGVTAKRFENESLVYRIFSDTGSSGKDLLGNEYREGVRYNDASNAIDGKMYTNWTCFPNPSSEGVEALYFDVRSLSGGTYVQSVIDAIEVNTLTPGVRMNVYYSEQKLNSAPRKVEEWENIMWTPLRESFKLNQKQTIEFPYPVVANWICLEFYNLQPILMSLSNHPLLPEVPFKEFPQWVYSGNPSPVKTSDQDYINRERFVDFTVIDSVMSRIENKDGSRVYSDFPQSLEQNYNINGFGTADPRLLGKISFSQNPYANPTINMVDTNSALGGFVYDDYLNDHTQTYIAESQKYPRLIGNRTVSNANDRIAASRDPEKNLSFNRVCAHQYAVKKGRYNKKAYTVSISEVAFLKIDYTSQSDDSVIHDVLVVGDTQQSILVEYSNWEPEQRISIPIGSPIFVTYSIGDETYEDELVYLENNSDVPSFEPVDLLASGAPATGVIARSGPYGGGNTYYRDQDFLIVYDPATSKNSIKRYDIPARLVIPNIAHAIDKYTVHGAAIISTEIDYDLREVGDPARVPLSSGLGKTNMPELEKHGSITQPTILKSIRSLVSGQTTTYATLTEVK